MKSLFFAFIVCLVPSLCFAQKTANQEEFDLFIKNLETEFIYYEQKKGIIDCIKTAYRPHVDTVSQPYFKAIFYELLLNELYDSHVNLNTNTDRSYRLSSPIYVQEKGGRFYITNVFASQLEIDFPNVINAELLSFNGQPFDEAIRDFPLTVTTKTTRK